MLRSTIQIFYTRGPRIAIKSPLDRARIESEIVNARASGRMIKLESLPENPREADTASVFVYLEPEGIAWISVKEEKEQTSSLLAP